MMSEFGLKRDLNSVRETIIQTQCTFFNSSKIDDFPQFLTDFVFMMNIWTHTYDPEIEDRGILFLSCLSVCHSVILFETLILLMIFEQLVQELWCFT